MEQRYKASTSMRNSKKKTRKVFKAGLAKKLKSKRENHGKVCLFKTRRSIVLMVPAIFDFRSVFKIGSSQFRFKNEALKRTQLGSLEQQTFFLWKEGSKKWEGDRIPKLPCKLIFGNSESMSNYARFERFPATSY